MGADPYLDAISELQNPSSLASAVAALRHLKNEAIGHYEKKELFVTHGIIDILSQILISCAKARGKRREPETSSCPDSTHLHPHWTDEDEARLQAILLLDCLAHGGPPFVTPILASSVIPALFTSLSPTENAPKIVVATLKVLVTLTQISRFTNPQVESFQTSVYAEKLYSPSNIHALAQVLTPKTTPGGARTTPTLVCKLLVETCTAEHHREALMSGGILDLLAAILASYIHQAPASKCRPSLNLTSILPIPPAAKDRHWLFAAISCIVGDSRYRVARLLCSPIIVGSAPASKSTTASHTRSYSVNDITVPRVHETQNHKDETPSSKAFPALQSLQPSIKQPTYGDLTTESTGAMARACSDAMPESYLVDQLLFMVRSEHGLARLEAANLLITLSRSGCMDKSRDRYLSVLVVPLVVPCLAGGPSPFSDEPPDSQRRHTETKRIQERASVILGRLIENSPVLQKAASDAGAIEMVCKLLRLTFGKDEDQAVIWSPNPTLPALHGLSLSCQLGPAALRTHYVHQQKIREGTLGCLAAIAEQEDKYRKVLASNGIISYLIDTLTPYRDGVQDGDALNAEDKEESRNCGNTVPVLLAACKATKTLSRSVHVLRTSLIDAGIAKPIFSLLKHPNVSVLIEASNVICNLIIDFSPMRHDLVEAGAIKTLCEHAHSANSQIRLVSLWALKHLVWRSPNDVKIQCIESLGTEWLTQIITGGPGNVTLPRSYGRSSNPLAIGVTNAAGERVDILNAPDERMDTGEESDDRIEAVSQSTVEHTSDSSLALVADYPELVILAEQQKSLLRNLKEADERATALDAYRDELAIRTQGMDFIRNTIQGPDAADMIEYLFQALGSNSVFDVLLSKLKPEPVPPGLINLSSTAPSIAEPANAMLHAAVFTLVHLAAGAPRHRQQLISQTQILRSLLQLLTHPDPGIRVSSIWVVNNLTWIDDHTDQQGARQRAMELRRLGFEEVLLSLQADETFDVKERAATGLDQIRSLLDPSSSSSNAALSSHIHSSVSLNR